MAESMNAMLLGLPQGHSVHSFSSRWQVGLLQTALEHSLSSEKASNAQTYMLLCASSRSPSAGFTSGSSPTTQPDATKIDCVARTNERTMADDMVLSPW